MTDAKVPIPNEIFYYEDPAAPAPNVPMHPGVSAVIFNQNRNILFMKRTRGDYWCMPGGRMDMDESAQDCCVRETLEETGLQTRIVRLIASNSNPSCVVHYPDGNVHRSLVLCFEVKITGGELHPSSESQEFRWCCPEDLKDMKVIPDSLLNAMDAWANEPAAFIR